MIPLRLIGYWIRSLDDDEFPPPQELFTRWEPDLQAKVINYLNSGIVLSHFRGLTWCRCFCEKSMGSRELTDGEWVWPEDLAHYVHDHSVQLPEGFVQSACGDAAERVRPDGRPVVDKSYWISWSAKHRSHSLRSRIQIARGKAMIKSRRLRDFAIARLERSTSLSKKQCREDNCTKPALSGCRYCLDCYVETALSYRIRRPFGNLKPVLQGT